MELIDSTSYSQLAVEQKREALKRVLCSATFVRAPGLSRFLEYVCSEILEGRGDSLKEYTIAVEALGRPADFDPKRDSIVRVQAIRLRKRLHEYYDTYGTDQAVQIFLPEGSYVPEFIPFDKSKLPEPVLQNRAGEAAEPANAVSTRRIGGKFWLAAIWGAALCVLTVAIAFVALRSSREPRETTSKRAAPVSALTSPAATPLEIPIRILAGRGPGRHEDLNRNTWEGDRFFRGGIAVPTPPGINVRGYDPDLFGASRRGKFTYDFPLPKGLYEVHLFFAETEFAQNNLLSGADDDRNFDILCNNKVLVSGFDIYKHAGDSNTADALVLPGLSPDKDGFLHLRFAPRVGQPLVNAIEVIRTDSQKMLPIRMVCLRFKHKDTAGNVWEPDRYVRGGELVFRALPSIWPADPELCRGERYGRFSYDIPVAPGSYKVNLYFTESWFSSTDRSAGVGNRLFSVAINQQLVLKNFDILKEAGGSYRVIRKSFRGVRANGRSKITLDFEPMANYAALNAIEIIPD